VGPPARRTFAAGTSVTLTATPAAGSVFTGWSVADARDGTCTLTVATATTVKRRVRAGAGGGDGRAPPGSETAGVASAPAGITCGTTCSASFPWGARSSSPRRRAVGQCFGGWSGGGSREPDLHRHRPRARRPSPRRSLLLATVGAHLTVSGGGTGTVTSAPAGVTCSLVCTAPFAMGTSVALTATAGRGLGVTGWSGACSGLRVLHRRPRPGRAR